jgi:RHS repeat-associated protein
LEDRYEYDAFGTPYKGDLESGMNLGYTGKPYNSATGMYDYGYRDYKPEMARFTTIDPVRDGANWFAYVNNDPVNWVDKFGLETIYAYDVTSGLYANGDQITAESWTNYSNDEKKANDHRDEKIESLQNDTNFTQSKDNPGNFSASPAPGVIATVTISEVLPVERPDNIPPKTDDAVVSVPGTIKSNGLCGK